MGNNGLNRMINVNSRDAKLKIVFVFPNWSRNSNVQEKLKVRKILLDNSIKISNSERVSKEICLFSSDEKKMCYHFESRSMAFIRNAFWISYFYGVIKNFFLPLILYHTSFFKILLHKISPNFNHYFYLGIIWNCKYCKKYSNKVNIMF